MSKKLKIIIAIILALILALGIYIAPRVIPYTPPTPNIIKTDQGSFELRFLYGNYYNIEPYRQYEYYAKDYYSRLPKKIKKNNLIINLNNYVSEGGNLGPSITFTVAYPNDINLFPAIYNFNSDRNYLNFIFTDRLIFNTFIKYSNGGSSQRTTVEELLQQPEYQQYKVN